MGRTFAQCRYCRCGSAPSSAGRTFRQASWCSQRLCHPVSSFSASCISFWRSGLLPTVVPPPIFPPGSKRPRKRHRAHTRPVQVRQTFHRAGIWPSRRKLGLLAGLLISCQPLVRRAPPDFDSDVRPRLQQGGDVFLGLEHLLPARTRLFGSHPFDGRLRVSEDRGLF